MKRGGSDATIDRPRVQWQGECIRREKNVKERVREQGGAALQAKAPTKLSCERAHPLTSTTHCGEGVGRRRKVTQHAHIAVDIIEPRDKARGIKERVHRRGDIAVDILERGE
jgi:hypothetical protein